MSESFKPLSLSSPEKDSVFVPLQSKLTSPKAIDSETGGVPSHSPETCASPKVTLQRENEVVTSIKIECPCGQIIELACVY